MPFMTPKYVYQYDPDMIVYDLDDLCYTTDGKVWNDIPIDHL